MGMRLHLYSCKQPCCVLDALSSCVGLPVRSAADVLVGMATQSVVLSADPHPQVWRAK